MYRVIKMVNLKGFEGFYKVNGDLGLVWSVGGRHGSNHNGRYLKSSLDKDGYNKLTISSPNSKRKTVRVGVAILSSYIEKPFSDAQVNHKNGIRTDDRLCNLEWVTASENIKHSFEKLGKSQKCSKNNCFKPWGFELNGERHEFNDKSVDTWCAENKTASTTVYASMRSGNQLSRGKFKGYRFYRIKDEYGSTNK